MTTKAIDNSNLARLLVVILPKDGLFFRHSKGVIIQSGAQLISNEEVFLLSIFIIMITNIRGNANPSYNVFANVKST